MNRKLAALGKKKFARRVDSKQHILFFLKISTFLKS
jgi:hypothetical protein